MSEFFRESDPRLADIFVTKGAFLKLYSQYIMEYDAKCQLLSESRKKFFEFDRVTSAFEVRKKCSSRYSCCCNVLSRTCMRMPLRFAE